MPETEQLICRTCLYWYKPYVDTGRCESTNSPHYMFHTKGSTTCRWWKAFVVCPHCEGGWVSGLEEGDVDYCNSCNGSGKVEVNG
jgi:DnaJ-class molecular chaperone